MAKNIHLTLSDRIVIESSLRDGSSFKQIAQELGKDPSTISKEVRGHYKVVEKDTFNPCIHRRECKHYADLCNPCKFKWGKSCKQCTGCFTHCPDFEEKHCIKLQKPPYVCNGCKERNGCKLRRHLYDAKFAQTEYETVRSESRQGFATTPTELKRIDDVIAPLVKQGQSIHQICANNTDLIMLDERTIYNYIDAGLLSVGNLDLPRKVRYKARKKKKPLRVDKQCHLGRTYDDFLEYTAANPDIPVVEMDSVEGRKGGKVLLTLFFRNCNLMIAYIRDTNTARSVTEIFQGLYKSLGRETFCRLFPIILTDRGSEFTDPVSLECDEWGEVRTRVFYCDPQRPDQKGGAEVTHEFIRRILPKGTSFNDLTQDDITLMMSHINSYTRKKLNNRSAHQLFSFFYGENILDVLNIRKVPANDINLTPRLLKK
jgi:IS30 family transposase